MMSKYLILLIGLVMLNGNLFSQELQGKKLVKSANEMVENGKERDAITLLTSNFHKDDKSVDLVVLNLSQLLVKHKLLDSANFYLSLIKIEESGKKSGELMTLKTEIDSLKEQYQIATISAWRAFDNEDYLTSDQEFSKALSIDEGYYESYAGKAEILFVGGNYKEAIQGFKESLTKYFPNEKEKAHVYEHLAEAYLAERNAFKTIQVCDEGLALEKENGKLLKYKATALYYQRQFMDAEEYFTQYLRFFPEDAEVLYMKGACFYNEKDYTNAIEVFTEAIKFKSINDAYNLRGRSYYETKVYDKAILDFQYLSNQFEGNFYAINAIGVVYYAENRFDSSIFYLEQAAESSGLYRHQFNLIKSYIAGAEYDKAISFCQTIEDGAKNQVTFYILFCEALMKSGNYMEAQLKLETAMEVNPFIKEYIEMAVIIYEKNGDTMRSKDFNSKSQGMNLYPQNMSMKLD